MEGERSRSWLEEVAKVVGDRMIHMYILRKMQLVSSTMGIGRVGRHASGVADRVSMRKEMHV